MTRYVVVNLTPDGRHQLWADIEANTPEAVKAYIERLADDDDGQHAKATRLLVGTRMSGGYTTIDACSARVYDVEVETIPERVIPARTVVHVRPA